MESRVLFMKGEIKRLKQILNISYEYSSYSSALDDEERFIKIIQLLFEINKKINKRFYLIKILYQLL